MPLFAYAREVAGGQRRPPATSAAAAERFSLPTDGRVGGRGAREHLVLGRVLAGDDPAEDRVLASAPSPDPTIGR